MDNVFKYTGYLEVTPWSNMKNYYTLHFCDHISCAPLFYTLSTHYACNNIFNVCPAIASVSLYGPEFSCNFLGNYWYYYRNTNKAILISRLIWDILTNFAAVSAMQKQNQKQNFLKHSRNTRKASLKRQRDTFKTSMQSIFFQERAPFHSGAIQAVDWQ